MKAVEYNGRNVVKIYNKDDNDTMKSAMAETLYR